VKAIAEAHHGRVELLSKPGQGSTFTIVFPVDQPETLIDASQP
jgi:signal transduction histidine kinase